MRKNLSAKMWQKNAVLPFITVCNSFLPLTSFGWTFCDSFTTDWNSASIFAFVVFLPKKVVLLLFALFAQRGWSSWKKDKCVL
jgi:biotin transporter BioY